MITILSWQFISSLIFLIILTYLLPKKLERLSSIVCCVVFLALFSPISLGILTITTIALYFSILIRKQSTSKLIVTLVFFIAILFTFKYLTTLDRASNILALGVSYYILREIHCLFEAYKNQLPSRKFIDLISYMFFLPTFLAGPINRYDQYVRDLRRKRWDSKQFSRGLERILFGYFKVVVLSEYLIKTKLVIILQHIHVSKIITIYFNSIIYWFDLYFQFSGYSDIAIGFSALAGFTIIENFNFPFIAINIIDFWSRWHISLTSWCRDYIYKPLLSFTRKPFVAISTAMISLGLWHALSIKYILWGIYHALGITIYHIFQKNKQKLNLSKNKAITTVCKYSSWFITINFVILSYPITTYLQQQIYFYWQGSIKCILS